MKIHFLELFFVEYCSLKAHFVSINFDYIDSYFYGPLLHADPELQCLQLFSCESGILYSNLLSRIILRCDLGIALSQKIQKCGNSAYYLQSFNIETIILKKNKFFFAL